MTSQEKADVLLLEWWDGRIEQARQEEMRERLANLAKRLEAVRPYGAKE